MTFASGVHAAIVEVDPGTGGVRILRYVVVHDCGRMVNPTIVEGQVLGGLAQGIGGALLERLTFDPAGQPQTTSFMDFRLPTVDDIRRSSWLTSRRRRRSTRSASRALARPASSRSRPSSPRPSRTP